jgi:hypothetical protein
MSSLLRGRRCLSVHFTAASFPSSLSLFLSFFLSLCLFPVELCVPCEKKQARTCLQAKLEGKRNKTKPKPKYTKLTAKRDPPTTTNPDGWMDGRTDGRIEGFVESFYIQQNNNTVSERVSERASNAKEQSQQESWGQSKKEV